jgi:hypothetical protein
MGLKGVVKQMVLEKIKATRETWHRITKARQPGVGMAVLVDELTRVPTIAPSHGDFKRGAQTTREVTLSTDALKFAMVGPHLEALARGTAQVVVSMWDDATRVPAEKKKTQDSRVVAQKKAGGPPPYPVGTYFTPGGVVVRGSGGVPQLIELKRFAPSRHMRRLLCDSIVEDFSRDYAERIPEGCTYILDYDAKGPWMFTRNGARQMTEWAHPFGEADLMTVFWCRVMRGLQVYVKTVDSDIFIILLNYVNRHECVGVYYDWFRNDTTKPRAPKVIEGKEPKMPPAVPVEGKSVRRQGFVDMKAMCAVLGDRVFALTLASILCGTDFYEKTGLFKNRGIGDESVLSWALESSVYCKNAATGGDWDCSKAMRTQPNIWAYPLASPIVMRAFREESKGLGGRLPGDGKGSRDIKVDRCPGITQIATQIESIGRYAKKPKAPLFTIEGAYSLMWNLQYWMPDLNAVVARYVKPADSSSSLS